MENERKTTIIEEARKDFQSIVDFAKENVSVEIQQKVEDQIAKMINEGSLSLVDSDKERSTQKEAQNEGTVTITVDVDGEDMEVNTGDDEEVITGEEGEEMYEDFFEISEDAEEYEITDEMKLHNENEPSVAPEVAPAPATEAPAAEMPTEKGGTDLNTMTPEELLAYAVEQVVKSSGGVADASGEEAVEIIDDEVPAEVPAEPIAEPAPSAAPAPVEEPVAEEIDLDSLLEDEDTVIEITSDENEDLGEISEDDIIEIESDDSDETVDEMKAMGVSHTVQRGTGTSAGPQKSVDARSRNANVHENIAHKDVLNTELKDDNKRLVNENAVLKKEVQKLRNALPTLRKQINEMKEFNAKVGFMLRLFEHGDFTKEQRVQISERFEQVDNYNDAKLLYKEVMNEHEVKVDKPKSLKPSTSGNNVDRPSASKGTIYESRNPNGIEVSDKKRMQELTFYGQKK